MKCFCVSQAKVLRFNNIDCQLVQAVSLPWWTYQLLERQSWAIKNHISQFQMHPYCHFIQNLFFFFMLESILVREKFSSFSLPTMLSLLAKLRERYIAHKLAAVSWLKSCMQHPFQHQSIIIRREHTALHVFVLCFSCKAPGKDSAAEQAIAQWEKDSPSQGQTLGKKIGRLKPRRAEGLAAEVRAVLAMQRLWEWLGAARWQSARINLSCQEKQTMQDETERLTTPESAVPGNLWLLSSFCQEFFKALVAGGLLEGNSRDTGAGPSLAIVDCGTKSVAGTMHIVLWQTVYVLSPWLVVSVHTTGKHFSLLSQHSIEGLWAKTNPAYFSRTFPNQIIS